MKRALLCVLLAGCAPASTPAPAPERPGKPAEKTKGLTEEEKVAWERVRKRHGPGWLLAARTTDGWAQWDVSVDRGGVFRDWPGDLSVPGKSDNPEQDCRRGALQEASRPNHRWTVVIDLTGGPRPRAVAWFRDEGQGVKEVKAPPADVVAEFEAHVPHLQRLWIER